jgi:hypothetical protein
VDEPTTTIDVPPGEIPPRSVDVMGSASLLGDLATERIETPGAGDAWSRAK